MILTVVWVCIDHSNWNWIVSVIFAACHVMSNLVQLMRRRNGSVGAYTVPALGRPVFWIRATKWLIKIARLLMTSECYPLSIVEVMNVNVATTSTSWALMNVRRDSWPGPNIFSSCWNFLISPKPCLRRLASTWGSLHAHTSLGFFLGLNSIVQFSSAFIIEEKASDLLS